MSRSQPELNPWTQRPPYRVPRHPAVTDLQLAGNEGAPPRRRSPRGWGRWPPSSCRSIRIPARSSVASLRATVSMTTKC